MACPKSELNLVFPNANGKYMDSQNMMKKHLLNPMRTGSEILIENINVEDVLAVSLINDVFNWDNDGASTPFDELFGEF